MNRIGDKIRRYRLEKRLSERDIAEQMGISQSTYHKKEMGESSISVPELLKLAQILDEPVEDLLKDEMAVYNIQYNAGTNNNQPQNNYNSSDTNLWEALVAAKESVIERYKAENDLLRAEIARLKGESA